MVREVQRELAARVSLVSYGLGLAWQATWRWTAAWLLLLLLQGAIPALQVHFVRLAVNGFAELAGPAFWLPIFSIALLWIAGQLLSSLSSWVRRAQVDRVQDHIHGLIQAQALKVDLAFFEHPDSYDLLHRARVDAPSQPMILLENLGALIQNCLTLLVLAAMLTAYSPWLPLLLVGGALPGLLAVARQSLREHRWRLQQTVNERKARYLDTLLTDRHGAAELRLFELGAFHRRAFRQVRAHFHAGLDRLSTESLKAEVVAGTLTWIGGLLGMGWVIWRAIVGLVGLGDIVLCYQAFQQSQRLLRSLLDSATKIYRASLFLENLRRFSSLEPAICRPAHVRPMPEPSRAAIHFENVTFRYPGETAPALQGFTLEIDAGSVVALVGHNGAGKSTLVKLLCRFYDPQEGRISLGGVDLRELDPLELRRQISVLFQEPVRYCATAAENITMGDLRVSPDSSRVRQAARDAGADVPIERLPREYQTMLGKWFGGAELSVGEWQRLALARAFLRRAPIVVLDEPTSAMDSWSELDWMSRFRELTTGRTALMITHRFTTAKHADVIHVVERGRIVESGTHQQLVGRDGIYAESWQLQMGEAYA